MIAHKSRVNEPQSREKTQQNVRRERRRRVPRSRLWLLMCRARATLISNKCFDRCSSCTNGKWSKSGAVCLKGRPGSFCTMASSPRRSFSREFLLPTRVAFRVQWVPMKSFDDLANFGEIGSKGAASKGWTRRKQWQIMLTRKGLRLRLFVLQKIVTRLWGLVEHWKTKKNYQQTPRAVLTQLPTLRPHNCS